MATFYSTLKIAPTDIQEGIKPSFSMLQPWTGYYYLRNWHDAISQLEES